MTVNNIRILQYDSRWRRIYEEEKAKILGVVGHWVVAIEHIGSTAVPGLGAKPIIDIIAALGRLPDIENCIRPLQSIGYEYLGEYGMPGRHFLRKPPGDATARTHHLHIVEDESDLWEKHILFRDYLRTHPEVAHKYYDLKKDFANKYGSNRDAYTEAKTSFIESVVRKARPDSA